MLALLIMLNNRSFIHSSFYSWVIAVSTLACVLLLSIHCVTFNVYLKASNKKAGLSIILLKVFFDFVNVVCVHCCFYNSLIPYAQYKSLSYLSISLFCNLTLCGFAYAYINTDTTSILLEAFVSLLYQVVISFSCVKLRRELSLVYDLPSLPLEERSQQQISTNVDILRQMQVVIHLCDETDLSNILPNIVPSEDVICETCPCNICFETLNRSKVYVLRCVHRFHVDCLETWVKNSLHFDCPTCRGSILS